MREECSVSVVERLCGVVNGEGVDGSFVIRALSES